jgi:hypothetical protein
MAVIQALRVNPDTYDIIFGNTRYDNTNNNEYVGAVREVASSFLNKLSNQIVDKTMLAATTMKGE